MASEQQVVLVTGASRGLGRGIALRLAELGFSVAANYFEESPDAANETMSACAARSIKTTQKFVPILANIGNHDDRVRLVSTTLEKLGRIDALVNNAGIAPRMRADITEMSLESYREVLGVNLEGTFFLTQTVVRHWLAGTFKPILPGGFTIVNTSSISATAVSVNRGEYCISKAGVAMVTQLWAVRLASAGIHVYELRPGIMATDMTRGVKDKYDKLIADGLVPLNRWGQPEDMGRAVGSLLTGDFPYSTGEVIYVDGGMHIPRL
jgi:3-oxoacyl-[acyl-carrier protein] reductase